MKVHQPQTPLTSSSKSIRTLRVTRGSINRMILVATLVAGSMSSFAKPRTALPIEQGLSTSQSTPIGQPKDTQTIPAPATPPSAPPSTSPTVPLPSVAPNSTTAGAIDNARYVIGADDNLQITVWREPSLSGVLPVRPDGMISLVLIGDLKAAGRTPTQLSGDIAQQLKKYIQDPSVTVAVTAVNSQRIFLVGEVGHVGPVAMSPAMTPLQAISSAGGPSPYANLKRIYILRGLGARQQKIPFNYKQALKGDNRQDIILQPGDTIVVP